MMTGRLRGQNMGSIQYYSAGAGRDPLFSEGWNRENRPAARCGEALPRRH